MPFKHDNTVGGSLRDTKRFQLVTTLNDKTPKGEKFGYLQGIVYLAPHTLGGGKTLCAHSTDACREGCLFTAGRGQTPRVRDARLRRTRWYLDDRSDFLARLYHELADLQRVADSNDMALAIRLNGTSDIFWEREMLGGLTLFEALDRATFFDYSRSPAQHRRVPPNWRLTFSLADDPLAFALDHLRAGRNVAAVVPQADIAGAPESFTLGDTTVHVVNGDSHDLRFLDPSPALVLLKPKGRLRRGGPMVRTDLIRDLTLASETA